MFLAVRTTIPGCGAAWQEALYCPSAKFHDGVWPQAKLLQVPETIQALLGLFNHCRDMATLSQVLLNVHPDTVFEGIHSLHRCAINVIGL